MNLRQAMDIVERYGLPGHIDSHQFRCAMRVVVENRDRLPYPVVYIHRGAPHGSTFQALERFKMLANRECIDGEEAFVLYRAQSVS